jgi:hypothetical protein
MPVYFKAPSQVLSKTTENLTMDHVPNEVLIEYTCITAELTCSNEVLGKVSPLG